MTREEFAATALSFPGVEAGTSYGQPSFLLRGKFFTRVRSDDDSAVIQEVPPDERDLLIEAEPETFHVTPHYAGYPIVLARLGALDEAQLRGFLERRWRKMATKAMLKARDQRASPSPSWERGTARRAVERDAPPTEIHLRCSSPNRSRKAF